MIKQELWLNEKGQDALKSKQWNLVRYKKGTVANSKDDIQTLLDDSVVIEILEQINYQDGLEGATVRFRFIKK